MSSGTGPRAAGAKTQSNSVKARANISPHLSIGKRELTILKGDDAGDLLAELGQEVLLGAHGQHPLLA